MQRFLGFLGPLGASCGGSAANRGFPNQTLGSPSAASAATATADAGATRAGPFSAELPAAILEVVRAEPSGAVGLGYRRYITTTLLPALRRVAAIMQNHAAVLEVSSSRTTFLRGITEWLGNRVSLTGGSALAPQPPTACPPPRAAGLWPLTHAVSQP